MIFESATSYKETLAMRNDPAAITCSEAGCLGNDSAELADRTLLHPIPLPYHYCCILPVALKASVG